MYNIFLVDIVSSAFINKMKAGQHPAFITFEELENYGRKVVEILRKNYNEDANLILSRDNTDAFFEKYEAWFVPAEEKEGKGVGIARYFTKSELIQQFVGYLPLNLLLALNSKEAVKTLGIEI